MLEAVLRTEVNSWTLCKLCTAHG